MAAPSALYTVSSGVSGSVLIPGWRRISAANV
jgi:hypothetical protein